MREAGGQVILQALKEAGGQIVLQALKEAGGQVVLRVVKQAGGQVVLQAVKQAGGQAEQQAASQAGQPAVLSHARANTSASQVGLPAGAICAATGSYLAEAWPAEQAAQTGPHSWCLA